jgi:hypothetical protein
VRETVGQLFSLAISNAPFPAAGGANRVKLSRASNMATLHTNTVLAVTNTALFFAVFFGQDTNINLSVRNNAHLARSAFGAVQMSPFEVGGALEVPSAARAESAADVGLLGG